MATLVVGIDGSRESLEALAWALEEARGRDAAVRGVVAWRPPEIDYILDASPAVQAKVEQALASVGERVLEDALRAVPSAAAAGVQVERRVVTDAPAEALLRAATDADLLVVGSRGRGGFAGLMLGSVSQQVAHHAPCPVVIVRQRPADAGGAIVVGVDGSDASKEALRWAGEEARLRGVKLIAVHAWSSWPYLTAGPGLMTAAPVRAEELQHEVEAFLQAIVDEVLGERGTLDVEQLVVQASAASALVDVASGAGLLVVGSRGHGGFAGLLLGSVSQQVAHHARCPVVIVRRPG